MNAREEWLNARRAGLGGSDVAAILGLSPYRTALDVWLDKTGQAPDQKESEAMYFGTLLEDVVANEYARRSGNKVQRVKTMLAHPERPWMIGNIDRAVVAPGSRVRWEAGQLKGADGILECKTANAYVSKAWGSENDDEMPVHYVAQCMWYLGITGAPWCDLAVLIGGNRYLYKRIERDEETIAGMVAKAGAWWQAHVVDGIPPDPATGADAATLFRQDDGSSIEADADLTALICEAQQLKAEIAEREERLAGEKNPDALVSRIKARMGAASAITVGGQKVVTWKASKPTARTNWKAAASDLKAWAIENDIEGGVDDIRDIIDENTTVAEFGNRPFVIKE